MLLFFLLLTGILSLSTCQMRSPCPDIFAYEPTTTDDDRWYGVLSLRSNEDLNGVWIRVVLDRPAELLGNWFGETTSKYDQEFIIKNPNHKLSAGTLLNVRFFIKYRVDETPIPRFKTVLLNGRDLCGNTGTSNSNEPVLHISKPDREKPSSSSGFNGNVGYGGNGGNGASTGSGAGKRPSASSRPAGLSESTSNYGSIPNYNIDKVEPLPSRPSSNYDTNYEKGQSSIYDNENANNNRPSIRPVDTIGVENFEPSRPATMRPTSRPSSRPTSRPPVRPPAGPPVRPSPSSTYDNSGNGRPSSGSSSNYNTQSNNREESELPAIKPPTQSTNHLSTGDDNNFQTDDYFPGDFALSRPSASRPPPQRPTPPSKSRPSCGTVAMQANPLISYGSKTTKGQWPWHAALYHSQAGIQLMYTCGSTLISDVHVITAAHCVAKPHTNIAIQPESIIVYLGKHNLNTFGPEVQDREVDQIFVHPQYNYSVYFNDIAVLKLKTPVDFNNYVRPACLWGDGTDTDNIIDKLGTVVGWGFDENRKLSTHLMQAQMPVVSTVTCIYSNREFFSQFTFDKNYCAGFRNGTSVCNGDSGGGMVFPKTGSRGSSTVWQLRGIVSVGVALQGKGVCDPSHYIVFTDVAKYIDWIEKVMNQ